MSVSAAQLAASTTCTDLAVITFHVGRMRMIHLPLVHLVPCRTLVISLLRCHHHPSHGRLQPHHAQHRHQAHHLPHLQGKGPEPSVQVGLCHHPNSPQGTLTLPPLASPIAPGQEVTQLGYIQLASFGPGSFTVNSISS